MKKRRIVDTKGDLLRLQDEFFSIPKDDRKARDKVLQEMFMVFQEWHINKLLSYCHKHNFVMSDERIEELATDMSIKAVSFYKTHDYKVEYPTTYFTLYSFVAILYKKEKDPLVNALQDYTAEDFEDISCIANYIG